MVRKTYKYHEISIPQADDPTKTISKNNYISPTHHSEDGMIGFDAPDSTLVSNVLTPIDSVVVVRGEGAAADQIDHITYGAAPDIASLDLLWLQKGAEAITLKHNVATPPANSGPLLLLSQVDQLMPAARMTLLQRQGSNFQEIAFNGIVGNNGILVTDDAGKAIIVCGSVASAVNYLKVTNSATGVNVILEPAGTDTNIGLTIQGKGTGLVKILSQIVTTLYDANSKAWAKVVSTASAVNEITFTNNVTGSPPKIEATGTDTDIDLEINGKGVGYTKSLNLIVTNIREATGKAIAVVITAIASAVNYVEIKANITANDPEIQAKGSDTDIGIVFVPKGAGFLTLPSTLITAVKRIQNTLGTALGTTGTIDLDFSLNELVTMAAMTGNVTFTTSNLAAGRTKTIRIIGGASAYTFTFPAWKFIGAAAPASLAIGKYAVLTLTSISTTDAEVVAAYAVEP